MTITDVLHAADLSMLQQPGQTLLAEGTGHQS